MNFFKENFETQLTPQKFEMEIYQQKENDLKLSRFIR